MSDIDREELYFLAEAQAGYFMSGQAVDAGMDPSILSYHARPGGRYVRVRRGLYRLRHFPSSPAEHVRRFVAAAMGRRGAVGDC